MKRGLFAGLTATTLLLFARTYAATVTVTNGNDDLTGSLRQAIQLAHAGDTIRFNISTSDSHYDEGTRTFFVELSSGELVINKNLTIDGGSRRTEVRRRIGGTAPFFRVFHVTAGTVMFSGFTIGAGWASPGAGILNAGNLTITRCTVSENYGPAGGGVAIENTGTFTAINSTFANNNGQDANATINNSGMLRLINCTVVWNTINAFSTSSTAGVRNVGTAHVANTIIGRNGFTENGESDVLGTFISDGYNLIGLVDSSNGNGFGSGNSHDHVGLAPFPLDPQVGPLVDNGGPTFTMFPFATSPALDHGRGGGGTIDQIGMPRRIDLLSVANEPGGDGSDVGAAERDIDQTGTTLTVNTIDEHSDGICGVNDCTLFEAINASNASADPNNIVFRSGLTGTITTDNVFPRVLLIDTTVNIAGPGARKLTLSGSGRGQILQNRGVGVVISGLTFANGLSVEKGAALYNAGELTLRNCAFVNNTVPMGSGGAIGGEPGFTGLNTLAIQNCTFEGNQASEGGGALFCGGNEHVSVINSTFWNNTASFGGAIASNHAVTSLLHCTISGNTATAALGHQGGGVRTANGGSCSLDSTIIAGNHSGAATTVDVDGNFTSQGFNLIGENDGSTGLTDGVANDKVGTSASPLNAHLDPAGLKSNGGATDTMALRSNSVGINNARSPANPSRDQRNFVRIGAPDIGAFEFGGTIPATLANISTRALVQTGDNVLIGGFIITGTHAKRLLLRAIGPSLALTGKLANPILELHNSAGTLIASNDNWETATNHQEVADTGAAPTNSLESAILRSLSPGSYTAIVRGVSGATGIALVEGYDLDRTTDSKLANISTRGVVQTGNDVMIGGFVVLGPDSQKVIARAIGPSLPLTGKLADPILELHDASGTIITSNDNWRATQQAEIMATGIPPANNFESAIVRTLTPGRYTAIVRGVGGTTGLALIEVYALN